jgi:hypothetical protein
MVKVAGITRVADHPMNPIMAINFSYHVDHLVLGFDGFKGYHGCHDSGMVGKEWYEFFKQIRPFPSSVTVDMFITETRAGGRHLGDHYLEELLRRLDDVKPDVVLEIEADATMKFDKLWYDEFQEFVMGDFDLWLMRCENLVSDGREVPQFPVCEHCRAYKWFEGVSYDHGGGFCRPGLPKGKDKWKIYRGKSMLQHYAIFTLRLQEERWQYYGAHKVHLIYDEWNRHRANEEKKRAALANSG